MLFRDKNELLYYHGYLAHHKGIKRDPFHDEYFKTIIYNLKSDESDSELINSWLCGWDDAKVTLSSNDK